MQAHKPPQLRRARCWRPPQLQLGGCMPTHPPSSLCKASHTLPASPSYPTPHHTAPYAAGAATAAGAARPHPPRPRPPTSAASRHQTAKAWWDRKETQWNRLQRGCITGFGCNPAAKLQKRASRCARMPSAAHSVPSTQQPSAAPATERDDAAGPQGAGQGVGAPCVGAPHGAPRLSATGRRPAGRANDPTRHSQ